MDINMYNLEKIIIEAKKEYGSVFSVSIGDDLFIWRLLNHTEIEIIDKSSAGDPSLREELICQYAIIYPNDIIFSSWKAGVPSTLAPIILEESGLRSTNKIYEYLDKCKQDVRTNFYTQASIVIATSFPQYTFEDIEKWDIEKFLSMAAKAEWKLQVIDGKDFSFEKTEGEKDNTEKVDEKEQLIELEQKLIEIGADPILCLYDDFYKIKKQYSEFPFIVGRNWNREDVCDAVSKLLQKQVNK